MKLLTIFLIFSAAAGIACTELKSPVHIAEYLFTRLYQLGIRSVHGVPGDYNLESLDYLAKTGLRWVGNCNELNAGYAADGYARINGIAALITTFGVGELSAINAISGAYSEHVPIIHIVGHPATSVQHDKRIVHHSLGDGDFNAFVNMSARVSSFVAMLNDPQKAADYIDSALRECWIRSRPVYIALPTDMVKQNVEGERLKIPINIQIPPNEEEKEEYVVGAVLKNLHAAEKVVILVDVCAIRLRVLGEVNDLISLSGLPAFVTPMGKGSIDETLPNYGGTYDSRGSKTTVRSQVESSDLVLSIGSLKADFNANITGYNYLTSPLNTIKFHGDSTTIRGLEYPGVGMKGVLRKVINRVGRLNASSSYSLSRLQEDLGASNLPAITQAWLWPTVSHWLREDDIVITETGTAKYGIWETRFPKGVTGISQALWSSIGYALGACQGAALAAKERWIRRTILFVGDGSFQLTAQELSTIIRHDLTPIIFVICNNGYTIERLIHGMNASYNDIQPWKFKDLLPVFGAQPSQYATYEIHTKQELLDLFENRDFSSAQRLQFVELYMPQDDGPPGLKATIETGRNSTGRVRHPYFKQNIT